MPILQLGRVAYQVAILAVLYTPCITTKQTMDTSAAGGALSAELHSLRTDAHLDDAMYSSMNLSKNLEQFSIQYTRL